MNRDFHGTINLQSDYQIKWPTYEEVLFHASTVPPTGNTLHGELSGLRTKKCWSYADTVPHTIHGDIVHGTTNCSIQAAMYITRLSGLRTKKYCFMPVLCRLLVTHSMVN